VVRHLKKMWSTIVRAPFVFIGRMILTLIGMTSLRAGPDVMSHEEQAVIDNGFSRLLFDENGRPGIELLQLLKLVGMENLNESEEPIVQINRWAQKHLLRKGERWEEQSNRFEELKPKIKPLLADLGFVNATVPRFETYQGAIVHGALLPTVRLRLYYLIEQWKKGVRFTHLYFLSGERPLEPQYENNQALVTDEGVLLRIRRGWQVPAELPRTECGMIQLIWEQSDIPDDMREEVNVHYINAPMKHDLRSAKLLRPTTDDSVERWLQALPPHGRYLAISNAPYTHRQDVVIRGLAPKEGFEFDTIGPVADGHLKMAIFLDELARTIFQFREHFRSIGLQPISRLEL
jgi:hypothetical protein